MNIKTKYNLGDRVLYKGKPFVVKGISCVNLKKLILGEETKPEISLHLYHTSRIAFIREFASEDEVQPEKQAAAENMEPDEDDLHMENLADLSMQMTEIYHLADKAYAEEDLKDLYKYLSFMCKYWKIAWEGATDPAEEEGNYGIWYGLSMATSELEFLINNLRYYTRKLRKEMRGQDES